MSDYCTNCTHLARLKYTSYTEWRCTHDRYTGYLLQSLCGNPTKLAKCKENNWFKSKEKQMTTLEKQIAEYMKGIIDAWQEGKQIQSSRKNKEEWCDDAVRLGSFDFNNYKFRIKPEPKCRPYNAEELMQLKGKWLKNKYNVLVAVSEIHADKIMLGACGFKTPNTLLDFWTHEDGSPCGVEE